MTLTLAKTMGGTNGTPTACKHCKESHFIKSGIGWSCSNCWSYVPTQLKATSSLEQLKNNVKEFTVLHKELKSMIEELERLLRISPYS